MSSPPKLKFRKKIRQRDGIVLQDLANEITLEVSTKRGNNKTNFIQSEEEHVFNHIQDDIWFQIGNYINPEDVGTFALICRQTAHVVSCAIFWKSLYRRFCKNTKSLPDKLKSRCENQIGSIRSNVICALYRLYPPFLARVTKGYDMSLVHGYRCFNTWYRQLGPFWIYYFKLWNKTNSRKPKDLLDEDEDDDEYGLNGVLNKLNNVYENPEEGMCLIRLITTRFTPLPQYHTEKLVLYSTRKLLNADLRNTNVELVFLNTHSGIPSKIVYESCKPKVLPWWHPDYENTQLLTKL